jgi:YbbR domain-containing protein
VNRVLGLIFHNWPLKLAAIVLASMLYGGFVISQSVQEFDSPVRIDPVNLPATASLSGNLPQVTRIRYVSVGDASSRASTDTFRATIDLAGVDPAAEAPTFVSVKVESVDPRFTVVDYEPKGINVQLDPVKVRTGIPVRVDPGTAPAGLDVRPAVVTPGTVSVRGPASVVDRVKEVRADVVIEPSGLDVDREVDLIPVDEIGDRVTPVKVEPATAHVRIAVFSNLRSRPLPVTPVVTGTPAAGYEVTAINVEPLLVSVEGEADELVGLARADTVPISVNGATEDVVQDVDLALPPGVLPVGGEVTVRISVRIRPIVTTRTYDAGVAVTGNRPGFDYRLSTNHALATVGGALADLDRLDGATFVLTAPVGDLEPGEHEVTLTANLPVGLSLVLVEPAKVTITVAVLPSPSAAAAP